MSLSVREMLQTSDELKRNLEISGLSDAEVRAALGFTQQRYERSLTLSSVHDPTDVWRLRDYLEKRILEQGRRPHPYSKLISNIWYRYD